MTSLLAWIKHPTKPDLRWEEDLTLPKREILSRMRSLVDFAPLERWEESRVEQQAFVPRARVKYSLLDGKDEVEVVYCSPKVLDHTLFRHPRSQSKYVIHEAFPIFVAKVYRDGEPILHCPPTLSALMYERIDSRMSRHR